MVLPERSDFPPLGMARVDPHTEQEISVDALSKTIASAPQSRQLTFRLSLIHISEPTRRRGI